LLKITKVIRMGFEPMNPFRSTSLKVKRP